ncbi:MAG: aspartyl protease family protein [Candidatus Eremiobacteraeota bacterium]|nr:aspartyl protease family protein [Candidatus Eremiobacteraeota bacterium]
MKLRYFLSAAVAALALLPHAVHAVTTNDAAAIIAQHATYVGAPQGLVLTYRYVPDVKASPTPRPAPSASASPEPAWPRTRTIYRRGALYHEVREASGIHEEEGFTGRAFWSSDEHGYTVVDLEDAARNLLTDNLVEADLLSGADARVVGSKTIGGIATDVVRVTPQEGVPADVAIAHDGAYVAITFDPDHGGEPVYIDGYTDAAPGVRVQSGYHIGGQHGKWVLAEHAVRAVTNDDLRGPVPSATWDYASQDTSPIDIFEYQTAYGFLPRGQAVHVPASINGHTGTFLLDSGASGILLYRPYADKLGLTLLGPTGYSGVNGGFVSARYARAASLELGKNTLSNVVVTVSGAAFDGNDIDGILGYDFLAGALVDVDLAKLTIRIMNPSTFEPVVAKGAYAFPVNLASRTPEITIKAGTAQTRPIFDTGNALLAVLSDDLKNSGRLIALNDTIRVGGAGSFDYQVMAMGVDGPANVPARCSRLNRIEVGPYRYENVETCFGPARVFGRDGGLIGFDFLRHFNWTFDYPESKVVLTPNGK